ncbi:MAG: hypothetical protein ACYSUD_11930 [Planctomycetota bacterium]|jgi:hypothetical protein
MELTEDQEREIKAIMADMECPKGFRCYESGFEDLAPVEAFPRDNIVECRKSEEWYCPMALASSASKIFCKCPLRRYVALELGR